MKKSIFVIALIIALAISCTEVQPEQPSSAKSTVHVAVDFAYEQTKALSADENGITPSFSEGDVIYVFAKEASLGVSYNEYLGTLTNSKDNLSRFSGNLAVGYTNDGDYKVGFYYNQRDPESLKTDGKPDANKMTMDAEKYGEQTRGTLEEIASGFDIAKAETTLHCKVETFGEDSFFTREVSLNGPVSLQADQAIVKFVFKRSDTGEPMTNIQKLEFFYGIYYNTSKYEATKLIKTTLTDGTPRGEYYLAIQGTPNDDHRYLLTFLATTADERQFWSYKLLPHDFEPGKSYLSAVPMEKFDEKEPIDLGLSVNWYNINETANDVRVGTYDAIDWTQCGNFQLWEEDETKRAGWPTREQYLELMNENNTSFGWITISTWDGKAVNGYAVKSKKPGYTDRFIFFPAAGHVYNRGQVDASYQVPYGNQGFYWTGSYYKPGDNMSWTEVEFYFSSPNAGEEAGYTGTIKLDYGSVNYGFSLRKVVEKQGIPSTTVSSEDGFATSHTGYGNANEQTWK